MKLAEMETARGCVWQGEGVEENRVCRRITLTGIGEAGGGAFAPTTIVASALVAGLVQSGVDNFSALL